MHQPNLDVDTYSELKAVYTWLSLKSTKPPPLNSEASNDIMLKLVENHERRRKTFNMLWMTAKHVQVR